MAVDTRNKRASVLGIAAAITLTLPLADGAITQPDRQHVAFTYAGLSAAAITQIDFCETTVVSLMPSRRVRSLMPHRSVESLMPSRDVNEDCT